MKTFAITRLATAALLASLPALLSAAWQVGPCGRGGLCPGSYTPLPTSTVSPTPDPGAPTATPTFVPTPSFTPVPGAYDVHVDVGAAAGHTDALGQAWSADRPYGAGGFGYLDSAPAYRADGPVDGTADPERYRVFRMGSSLRYRFDVEDNASYDVILHFAEFIATDVNQRRIKVYLQGQQQVSNLDPYDMAGPGTAATRYYMATVASAPLDVELTGDLGLALLSAIEVRGRQALSGPTPTASPTATASPTPTPTPTAAPTGAVDPNAIQIRLMEPRGAVLLP